MNENILSHIAYLDDFPESEASAARSPELLEALVRYAIQREIAKRHLDDPHEVHARVASLESQVKQMEQMMRIMATHRGRPPVQYVLVSRRKEALSPVALAPSSVKPSLPAAMVLFYGAGLLCSLVFSVLLSLSAMGIAVIHPFLSLLGLVGGLGWLTTAWTDLLLWKREKPSGREPTEEERILSASNAR